MKKRYLAIAGTLVFALLFSGCDSQAPSEQASAVVSGATASPAPTPPGQAGYIKLAPQEAQAMMSDGDIIMDVRTQGEYDEGHIRNAILLPDYEIKEKAETVIADKGKTIFVYCRTGIRSERASKELLEMGYTHVYDFGGIVEWTGDFAD